MARDGRGRGGVRAGRGTSGAPPGSRLVARRLEAAGLRLRTTRLLGRPDAGRDAPEARSGTARGMPAPHHLSRHWQGSLARIVRCGSGASSRMSDEGRCSRRLFLHRLFPKPAIIFRDDVLERRFIAEAFASLRFQNPAATAAAIACAWSDPSIAAALDIHVACCHDLPRSAQRGGRRIDIYSYKHRWNSGEHGNASRDVSSLRIARSKAKPPRVAHGFYRRSFYR